MPYAITDDGVRLHYEEAGSGIPIIFVHEFAGDHRSWEAQMRHFSRGYLPSDVPDSPEQYSQARARDDIRDVLKHLGIDRAHVVGLSMGGFATLHFGMHYPQMARSIMVGGCGYGAAPSAREQFRTETEATAAAIERDTMAVVAKAYSLGPTRVQFQNKDPRGWQEFATQLAEHSTRGSALTMLGVQRKRPSLWDLQDDMRKISVPTLILNGDEDDPCLEPALLMKRLIPTAGLAIIARSGHTINIEEPDEFNRIVGQFIATVDAGRWSPRDARSISGGILGMNK